MSPELGAVLLADVTCSREGEICLSWSRGVAPGGQEVGEGAVARGVFVKQSQDRSRRGVHGQE